jgi:hypothetical protein
MAPAGVEVRQAKTPTGQIQPGSMTSAVYPAEAGLALLLAQDQGESLVSALKQDILLDILAMVRFACSTTVPRCRRFFQSPTVHGKKNFLLQRSHLFLSASSLRDWCRRAGGMKKLGLDLIPNRTATMF